jgi:hypothetical protein
MSSACASHSPRLLTGLLVFIGLWSRLSYCTGFLLLFALTVGSTLRQDWTAAGWQLRYAFASAALLAFREHNRYSVDRGRAKPIGETHGRNCGEHIALTPITIPGEENSMANSA